MSPASVATKSLTDVGDATPADSLRSDVYTLLSLAFSFPDASVQQHARSGQWTGELTSALAGLPYRIRISDLRWTAPATREEMESEYIRLFQIGGRAGPPCPLHSGFYARDRSRVLQQLIRFYNFFGFSLNECVMPDHICVELEFMALLAQSGASDRASLARAQKDFLRNNLAWTQSFADRVQSSAPVPFYRSLALFASRFVQVDSNFIQAAILPGGTHAQI